MNRTAGSQSQRRLSRPRGQPLVALVLLMASWVGARAAFWAPPDIANPIREPRMAAPADGSRPATLPPDKSPADPVPMPTFVPLDGPQPLPTLWPEEGSATLPSATGAIRFDKVSLLEVHQAMLTMARELPLVEREAGLSGPAPPAPLLVPMTLAAPASVPARSPVPAASAKNLPRWSGDAWMLLRPGGNGFNAPGAGLPGANNPAGFYGGSQIGAVLRYRLAPSSAWRPTLYLRAASGIERPRGEEVAFGAALRPVPGVPVAAMIEGRATRTITGTIVRPAVALVTELPPLRLPGGTRAELYVQAGYVGGRGATAFVDGQARIEKPLAELGAFRLRAGGGAWGGAQRGARRLDLGPTATVEIPLGGASSRLSADYRFRVAGGAAPGSGPAVTVSVGF